MNPGVDQERVSRIRTALTEAGLAGMICRQPASIVLAGGYWPLNGFTYLVFPTRGQPTLIVPAAETNESKPAWWPRRFFEWAHLKAGDTGAQIKAHLEQAIANGGMTRGVVGIELGGENLAPPLNLAEPLVVSASVTTFLATLVAPARVADVAPVLDALKSVKTPTEIEKLKRVARIAGFGMKAFAAVAREGLREVDIAAEVNYAVQTNGSGFKGAVNVRAFAQVASGPNTRLAYRPCEISSVRKVKNGDLVVLELALVVDGMWGDYTRVAVAGQARKQQLAIYHRLCQAQRAAMVAATPGALAGDVDHAAREVIAAAGLGEHFIHGTGHGVGFGYHDPAPLIAPGGRTVLQEGMVFTIEPGVYADGLGGMRIEDNVVLGSSGATYLFDNQRDLSAK